MLQEGAGHAQDEPVPGGDEAGGGGQEEPAPHLLRHHRGRQRYDQTDLRGVDFFVLFPLHPIAISVADPDPGSGAFLTPGSGMGRKSASGSGIRGEQPGLYFLELRNYFFGFFGVKILKFFDADSGSGIRDGDSSDP